MRLPHFLGAAALALTLAGCPSPESCPDDPLQGGAGPASWSVVLDEGSLPGVVLSVWGASPTDVFIAGGPLGNSGSSGLAMRRRCGAWEDLSPGGGETFWWVSGTSAEDVWFAGENGRLVHYDGAEMKDVPSGVTATLWGVFAFSPDDAWAVGGSPDKGTAAPNDIVLHYDGSSWKPETLPGAPRGVSLFKVWGTSDDDLYVVGEKSTIWHRTAAGWVFEGGDPPLVQSRLFTVHGCGADDVYAVGEFNVLHRDKAGWSKVNDIELVNIVNGVACGPAGSAVVVGNGSEKQRLVDGKWIDDFGTDPLSDLHGSWADGAGVFWAVGGDFLSPPKPGSRRRGVVARYGP